ncbi:MAG: YaaA family protein [Bacteroides sp.]|nr:YaaA family protein [Bacteroides sp.]
MITLIAESKNMSVPKGEFDTSSTALPVFHNVALEIAHTFAPMSVEEITDRLGLSFALASKAKKLFFDFQNGASEGKALYSFTGEVFRALNVAALPSSAIDFAKYKVGIISSIYGFLNPFDLVSPYRFDYDIENPSTGMRMRDYWQPKLTAAFVSILKERGEKEVVDLLPAEAAKCLDWKIIKDFAKVSKVNFKSVDDKGNLKTPYSGKLKELRGKLLREILIHNIASIADMLCISTPIFALDEDNSEKDYPLFVALP